MTVLKVGNLYHPEHRQWPETPHLSLGLQGPRLTLFLNRPTPMEVLAVRRGQVELAWLDEPSWGVLAYRITPGIDWSLVPYSPHEESAPPAGFDAVATRYRLHLVLVNALDGRVAAVRDVALGAELLAAMAATVTRLAATDFDPAAATRALDVLQDGYPEESAGVAAMVDALAVAREVAAVAS